MSSWRIMGITFLVFRGREDEVHVTACRLITTVEAFRDEDGSLPGGCVGKQ
jgi:hypothetical protein